MHIVQLGHATIHQVEESTWCGHNDLHTLTQGTNLLFYRGTSIDRLNVDAIQILRKVAQVVSYLQTKFTCRSQNKGMRQSPPNFAHLRVWHLGYPLQHGYTKCCRLTCTRLG